MGIPSRFKRLRVQNQSNDVGISDINTLIVPDRWLSITGPDEATLEDNDLVIDVREFGAVCDDVTDDSAAIQAAIDSLGTTATTRGGPKISIPCSSAIGSTILINRKSIVFSGLGWGRQGSTGTQSYLRWIGAAGSPMLRAQNVQGFSLRDLRFIGNAAAKPSCAISLFQEAGFGNNQNTIQNVSIGGVIDGTAAGVGFTSGILFEGATANNDTWFMDNIIIDGFTEYGIRQNSTQNVACSIRNLTITNGRDGVYIASSIYGHTWSFGPMSGSLIILPNLDDQAIITLPQVLIDLLIADAAPSRFIEFLGNGTVSINGGRFATGSNTAADGKIIKHEAEGDVTLRLTNVKWTAGSGSPSTDPFLSFRQAAYAGRMMATIILDGVPFLTGGPNANGLDAESRGVLDNKFVFWRPDQTSATDYGAIVGATNYIGGDFGGGDNYDPSRFDIPARLRRPPTADPQAITAAGNTIIADRSLLLIKNTTGGSITLTSTPTIANGATGEIVTIMNVGTQNIVLQDQGTLAGSNLRLAAAAITLAPRQCVELTYIGTPGSGTFTLGDWVQTGGVSTIAIAQGGTGAADAATARTNLGAGIVNAAAQSVLGAVFSITGTSGTYQDTGLSVALPAAGTYLVTANMRMALTSNAGTFWFITAKLFNSTDTADVANSETMGAVANAAGTIKYTMPLHAIVTVAAAKTIKLYAARHTDGSFTVSDIPSDASGRTRLSYIQIA